MLTALREACRAHLLQAEAVRKPALRRSAAPDALLATDLPLAAPPERVAAFRAAPAAEGINLKGLRRTTLKLFVPNLTFPEPIEMGENVWIYMGELCPAYCLYTPWEDGEKK